MKKPKSTPGTHTEKWGGDTVIWIDKRSIDPELVVQTNWVVYSAQEEAEGVCVTLLPPKPQDCEMSAKNGLYLIIFEHSSDQNF